MLVTRNGLGYTYDTNGNTLTGGGRTNVWDSQNRMYSCVYSGNTNAYTYGSDGLRRRSVTNGIRTDFAIDGTMAVREMRDTNSDGILESIATYFNGMYKRDDTNGTLRWYVYDGLGSVLAEVDPSGNVTAGRKYDVYGLVRSGQAGISKHKFVGRLGHPSEDETGLIYMRARYMDPVLGKFVTEDPARSGLNWYTYCGDSPINRMDYSGKEWTTYDEIALYLDALALVFGGLGWGAIGDGLEMMTQGRAIQLSASACPEELGAAIVMLGKAIEGSGGKMMASGTDLLVTSVMLRYAAKIIYALGDDSTFYFQDLWEMICQ